MNRFQTQIGIGIGFIIMAVPFIITGPLFVTSRAVGSLYLLDYVIKNISILLGLWVVYDALKNSMKDK